MSPLSSSVMVPLRRSLNHRCDRYREQRELYEAARVIQNAFRQYKARIRGQQQQQESERQAAIVIQSYYRRYKQYCYFKKLHRAAVLIQKHFRTYKAKQPTKDLDENDSSQARVQRGATSVVNETNNFQQMDTGNTLLGYHHRHNHHQSPDIGEQEPAYCSQNHCIRIQISPEELLRWKQHLAAIRIQHAFRGHYMRKRQAAARKIQKFMKESRQKLQKVRSSTLEDGVTPSELQLHCPQGAGFLTGTHENPTEQG